MTSKALRSMQTDQWFTPQVIIDKARRVLGQIDLDPASSPEANARVGAARIITAEEDGLVTEWTSGSVFLNPPGGRAPGVPSLPAAFWQKLMQVRTSGKLTHAIYIAYSLEQMQTTQRVGSLGVLHFPFCVPSQRMRFVKPDGTPGGSPTHSNAIVYVPGTQNETELFLSTFRDVGHVVWPRLGI